MIKIQTQLKAMLGTLSKSLVTLSKQVEKIAAKVEQIQPSSAPKKKAAPEKKAAPAKKAAAKSDTVIDTIFKAVAASKSGISIDDLKKKTRIEGRQLSNALYKLTKRGKIKPKSRGVYIS